MMPDAIRTNSGLYFNFRDPQPDQICIEDIAHALSGINRFNAHLDESYSVAQHCVMMADTAVERKAMRLHLLLHDAAEAYMGDMTAPLKNFFPEFKIMEGRVQDVIYESLGVKPPTLKQHEEIKRQDLFWLQWEWQMLMTKEAPPLFRVWPREEAKESFLNLYNILRS